MAVEVVSRELPSTSEMVAFEEAGAQSSSMMLRRGYMTAEKPLHATSATDNSFLTAQGPLFRPNLGDEHAPPSALHYAREDFHTPLTFEEEDRSDGIRLQQEEMGLQPQQEERSKLVHSPFPLPHSHQHQQRSSPMSLIEFLAQNGRSPPGVVAEAHQQPTQPEQHSNDAGQKIEIERLSHELQEAKAQVRLNVSVWL